jgi:hypothetical protein
MNKKKELLEYFSQEDQKVLKEEYNKIYKERQNKHSARVGMFKKAYDMKKGIIKFNDKKCKDEYIPERYVDYNNNRIIFENIENKATKYKDTISNALKSKYGLMITKVLVENDINIKDIEYISIVRVK